MALNFKSFCLYLLSAEIRGTSIPGGPRVTKAIENETMDKAHHSKSKKTTEFLLRGIIFKLCGSSWLILN